MEIDYPIKDKKQFLKQSLKGIKNLQSFTPSTQDEKDEIKQLEDFLTYVDTFDGKSPLQEQSREDFIPTTKKILKTLIRRNSPQDFRLSPYRNLGLLIDGMRESGYLADRENPPHYVVLNPEVIKIKARYQLKGYDFVKIEKPNEEGHFGTITPHTDKQQPLEPPQQMVADTFQTLNQESNNKGTSNQQLSTVESPKVQKSSQLSPELLAKNIHRYL